MIKFIADHDIREIQIVEVVNETNYYIETNKGRRIKKQQKHLSIFQTFDEAKKCLEEFKTEQIKNRENELGKLKRQLLEIQSIKVN